MLLLYAFLARNGRLRTDCFPRAKGRGRAREPLLFRSVCVKMGAKMCAYMEKYSAWFVGLYSRKFTRRIRLCASEQWLSRFVGNGPHLIAPDGTRAGAAGRKEFTTPTADV